MKIGDIAIALIGATLVVILARSCMKKESEEKNIETALNQCIEEVTNKCSASISYAIALEKENARLNRILKECRETNK